MNDKDSIIELSKDDEDKLEKNLVWIFGSPRSGTTWLGVELLSHSTKIMDEPNIGNHIVPLGVGKINTKREEYHKNRESYFFADKYKNTWNFYLKKLILNRIHIQFNDLSKKIIIKEPNGSIGAKNILECVPNSKIIFMIRDGRDVVDSLIDARSRKGWLSKISGKEITIKNRYEFMTEQSKVWVRRMNIVTSTYNNHPSKLRLKVKYEDLRKNTEEKLSKIYKFIGVDISNEELKRIANKHSFENIPEDKKGSGKFTRFASPGKWRENFSDEEQKIMNEIMGDTLKRLGYEK